MDDEDKQYPDEALTEADELGAHGMRVDGEDDEPEDAVAEDDAEDEMI